MTNLFLSFDPSSVWGGSLNWSILVLVFLSYPLNKGLEKARWGAMIAKVSISLAKEVAILLPSKSKAITFILLSLFTWVLVNNSSGLLPWVFTSTSHLAISLSLSLPLWTGLYLQGWFSSSTAMLAHLVPLGTPKGLMPFMVLIESVSGLIRPLTLAVRLSANLIAGHLLLTLLSSSVNFWSWGESTSVLSGQVCLILLEMAVAVIQAYVFMTLSALYASEV